MNTEQIKAKIIHILQRDILNSQDELYRIERMCGNLSEKQLNQEYGQSGRTLKEILERNRRMVDETNECINWIESH